MTVRTHGSLRRTLLSGASMHAFLVGDEGLRTHPIRLHQELLPMTSPARHRNIGMIHRRLSIVDCQNLVRAPMAILAVCRRRLATLARFRVGAVRISFLCIRMALHAPDLLRWSLVHQALYILVAIHTRKHRAVNRMLQLAFVYIQADLLAIHILCQRRVGMAGEAVFTFEFVRCVSLTGQDKQR